MQHVGEDTWSPAGAAMLARPAGDPPSYGQLTTVVTGVGVPVAFWNW